VTAFPDPWHGAVHSERAPSMGELGREAATAGARRSGGARLGVNADEWEWAYGDERGGKSAYAASVW
jgi:hypothetical protein